MVLEDFAKVKRSSPHSIKKEIAFKLLEDRLRLYIRYAHFLMLKTNFRLSKSEIEKQNQDFSEQA